ncbi:MAG: hypothetical protein U0T69_11295 [Chitinophagales bacterium]
MSSIIQETKLTDDELLAYYEKLATLTMTMNHLLNTIPEDQFKKQMKQTFGNTISHSNNFCKKLREEIYDTINDKKVDRDLTIKTDFVIPMLDAVLNVASLANPVAYAAFKNEMLMTGNKIVIKYAEDDPDCILVDTKPIELVTG